MPSAAVHVDNPYSGAKGYVNPGWKAKADAESGGSRVSNNPTGVRLDRIAAIMSDPRYGNLRIINVIEIDSLPNLVTNTGSREQATAMCDTMKANVNDVQGVRYAIDKLPNAGTNVYNYIDAYVWIKPPGESDGSSPLIPNDEGKGFDQMRDPGYGGNSRNQYNMTGALPNAPISGAWFSAQFQELMRNAYPAL